MPTSDAVDIAPEQAMARALALAELGLHTATPNPRVGCVIVANGSVVGEGWHLSAGNPHAEVVALQKAGESAKGATVYVTLEPCCVAGRTGPCTDALISAGVERVVYAMPDPNPEVDGRGHQQLTSAGVAVETGLLKDRAEWLNRGFARRMRTGRPWLMAKTASSLDGRTAMASGESQWITGTAARLQVQQLRAASCAVLTGIETILVDDPAMNLRANELGFKPHRQPALIIADSGLRIPLQAKVIEDAASTGRRLIVAYNDGAASEERATELAARGVELWPLAADTSGRVDLAALLAQAGNSEFNELMLEAGPTLLGQCLAHNLVDEMVSFIAPKVLGAEARPLAAVAVDKLADAKSFVLRDVVQLNDDAMLRCVNPASLES